MSLYTQYRRTVDYARSRLPQRCFRLLSKGKQLFIAPYEVPRLAIRKARLRRYAVEPKEIIFKGVKFMIVIDSKNGLVDESIALEGIWEEHIFECLSKHLRPGDVFLDVGANIGIFSLYAAKLVTDRGRVIACEPIPHLADQIHRSIALNGLDTITVHAIACGDVAGKATLYQRPGNIGGSTLRSVADENLFAGGEQISIDCVRLDAFLTPNQRIDFIKIDVEGYELHALRGMSKLLDMNKPKILIEFSPEFYKDMEGDIQAELATFLRDRGYACFTTSGDVISQDELLGLINQKDILCIATESGPC